MNTKFSNTGLVIACLVALVGIVVIFALPNRTQVSAVPAFQKATEQTLQKSFSDLSEAEKDSVTREYIRLRKLMVEGVSRWSGVPASILMASALLRTRAGTSALQRIKNPFAVKCYSNHRPNTHCQKIPKLGKDNYMVYYSEVESWKAHSMLITMGRYMKLPKQYGADYRQWAMGLESCGYEIEGVDQDKVAEALIGVIQRYELMR